MVSKILPIYVSVNNLEFSNFCFAHYRIEFVDIVAKYKPCNLGQGFPDYPVPSRVTQSLAEVSASDNVLVHQYTRGFVSIHILIIIRSIVVQIM